MGRIEVGLSTAVLSASEAVEGEDVIKVRDGEPKVNTLGDDDADVPTSATGMLVGEVGC